MSSRSRRYDDRYDDHGRHSGRRRSGHTRRSHGGGGWLIWVIIVAAVVLWGAGHQGDDAPRKDTPRQGNTSTVCTQYFKGGC